MKKAKREIKGGGGRLEEIRRIGRILDIIQNIAVAPRRWNRKALAEKYEVSERQIQKDLAVIRYGLHLNLDKEGDGYYLRNTPRIPTISYSFSEALALLMAARVGQSFPGINSVELISAIDRLESLFPGELVPLLRGATNHTIEFTGDRSRLEKLELLHRALAVKKQVRMVYRTASRGNALTTRIVEPYQIIPYLKIWVLVAFCHIRKEIREFNVDRIVDAEILNNSYEIPNEFDSGALFGHFWGVYRQSQKPPEDVELEFEPEAGQWVAEGVWHRSQKIFHKENGQIRLKLFISITPDFISWLLQFGWRLKVIKPAWLREEVNKEHSRAVQNLNINKKTK